MRARGRRRLGGFRRAGARRPAAGGAAARFADLADLAGVDEAVEGLLEICDDLNEGRQPGVATPSPRV